MLMDGLPFWYASSNPHRHVTTSKSRLPWETSRKGKLGKPSPLPFFLPAPPFQGYPTFCILWSRLFVESHVRNSLVGSLLVRSDSKPLRMPLPESEKDSKSSNRSGWASCPRTWEGSCEAESPPTEPLSRRCTLQSPKVRLGSSIAVTERAVRLGEHHGMTSCLAQTRRAGLNEPSLLGQIAWLDGSILVGRGPRRDAVRSMLVQYKS